MLFRNSHTHISSIITCIVYSCAWNIGPLEYHIMKPNCNQCFILVVSCKIFLKLIINNKSWKKREFTSQRITFVVISYFMRTSPSHHIIWIQDQDYFLLTHTVINLSKIYYCHIITCIRKHPNNAGLNYWSKLETFHHTII